MRLMVGFIEMFETRTVPIIPSVSNQGHERCTFLAAVTSMQYSYKEEDENTHIFRNSRKE